MFYLHDTTRIFRVLEQDMFLPVCDQVMVMQLPVILKNKYNLPVSLILSRSSGSSSVSQLSLRCSPADAASPCAAVCGHSGSLSRLHQHILSREHISYHVRKVKDRQKVCCLLPPHAPFSHFNTEPVRTRRCDCNRPLPSQVCPWSAVIVPAPYPCGITRLRQNAHEAGNVASLSLHFSRFGC